ncbi:MAG: hypothetical protein KME46_13245 [Brasilonema angustatum HA4187-MV1]|nr:hypothetical protein [Brasilonema angustatum HA4187-MV1]
MHKYLKCHVERSETSREILHCTTFRTLREAAKRLQNDIPKFWTFARGLFSEAIAFSQTQNTPQVMLLLRCQQDLFLQLEPITIIFGDR